MSAGSMARRVRRGRKHIEDAIGPVTEANEHIDEAYTLGRQAAESLEATISTLAAVAEHLNRAKAPGMLGATELTEAFNHVEPLRLEGSTSESALAMWEDTRHFAMMATKKYGQLQHAT